MSNPTDPKTRRVHPAVLNGGALIIVGVFFLLQQLGILSFNFWAVFVVFIGILRIAQSLDSEGRLWGLLLVAFGVALELNDRGFSRLRLDHVWPVFVIGAGIILMWRAYYQGHPPSRGAKSKDGSAAASSQAGGVASPEGGAGDSSQRGGLGSPQLNLFAILGGGEYRILSKDFRGGEMMAFMGGFDVDLREAEMEGNEATININVFLGGGVLKVPETWTVSMQVASFMGGHSLKTRERGPTQKTLIVKGNAIMGGIEIKN